MSRARIDRPHPSTAAQHRRAAVPPNFQCGSRRKTKTRKGAQRSHTEVEEELAVPRVLVAEDDDEMRQILREALEEVGYQVIEVADGSDLRRRLIKPSSPHRPYTPDIVVSDIRLPGFTGIEILEQLRRSDWSLPVILITAFGDDAIHEEAKRLGAALLLDKPFDVDDLVEAVLGLAPL